MLLSSSLSVFFYQDLYSDHFISSFEKTHYILKFFGFIYQRIKTFAFELTECVTGVFQLCSEQGGVTTQKGLTGICQALPGANVFSLNPHTSSESVVISILHREKNGSMLRETDRWSRIFL